MRQGYTNIQNEIFDLGLKGNEGWFCIWLLSHSSEYKITMHKITKELGYRFETIKTMIPIIEEKLYFARQDVAVEIMKKLSKIRVTHSKNRLEKCNNKLEKTSANLSKNREKNTLKIESIEITKNYQENTKEKFSPNNPFLIVPKNLGGEHLKSIEKKTKGFVSSLGDIAHKILGRA